MLILDNKLNAGSTYRRIRNGVSVREKPKGSGVWWIFIRHQGQRKSKKIGKDKRTAIEAAKKIEAKIILNDLNLDDSASESAPLFKDYAMLWHEKYIKTLRRQSTYERYGEILKKYINPVIGDMPINEIKRNNIRMMLINLHKAGYSRSTLSLTRDVTSGVMGYAVDDELIETNPVTGVLKRLKLEREKQLKIAPMSSQEVEIFLDVCGKKFNEYYPFFLCAFRTGMRLGELIALQWGDIDWNKKNIRVERSYRRGRVDRPKNNKKRLVDISDQLLIELKSLLTARKKEAIRLGLGEPVEIIFHRKGEYLEQNYIRRVFKRILKAAGLPEMKLHITRHTFASLLLSNGESPVYVKEQLGHSSINITVDIYGHLIPSSNRAAVNRLDNPDLSGTKWHPMGTL